MGALLTYFFTIFSMKDLNLTISSLKFNDIDKFGVSYWVSVACCLLMIIFAIYYRWSKERYHRFLIMEKLIDQDRLEDDDEFDLEH